MTEPTIAEVISWHTKQRSRTYKTWASMKERCQEYFKERHLYFDKGISVCDKWKTFSGFFEDMGERPEGKSLDRIDGSKGYFKENCRWATPSEQARNVSKRPNCTSKYKGVRWNNYNNRWKAAILVEGKQKHLGYFKNENEAAETYNRAAVRYFGDFAVINEIESPRAQKRKVTVEGWIDGLGMSEVTRFRSENLDNILSGKSYKATLTYETDAELEPNGSNRNDVASTSSLKISGLQAWIPVKSKCTSNHMCTNNWTKKTIWVCKECGETV